LELLLIRHGRSRADDEGRIEGGGYDAPLTDAGLRQAQALAGRLEAEAYRLDVLFSSPLCRAKQVADIVSKTVDVAVTVDARLAEQHTGRIAGLTFEEARSVQPVPEGGFRTYVPIPGGESLYDQLSRVMHFYADLLDHHMHRLTVNGPNDVVTHFLNDMSHLRTL